MSIEVEQVGNDTTDYGAEYKTKLNVKVIKKDGSKELFNVQKVVSAVGKSAYRALTKFTEEEIKKILEEMKAQKPEILPAEPDVEFVKLETERDLYKKFTNDLLAVMRRQALRDR